MWVGVFVRVRMCVRVCVCLCVRVCMCVRSTLCMVYRIVRWLKEMHLVISYLTSVQGKQGSNNNVV